MNETLQEQLQQEFGSPFSRAPKGKIGEINQRYFAGLVAGKHQVLFSPEEQKFYRYDAEKGIWQSDTDSLIKSVIGEEMYHYAVRERISGLAPKLSNGLLNSVLMLLKGQVEKHSAFASRPDYCFHCQNGMVCFDRDAMDWQLQPFAPEYYSRCQSPIVYDASATAPRFLNDLVTPAMSSDDQDLLQRYFGQCLLGTNLSQTFLLLTGTAGGGKSTLVNIIEGIVGRQNCTGLRLEHMTGRFETGRLVGHSLLTAKDVKSEFLSSAGAYMLKMLTGGDWAVGECKGANAQLELQGVFNVIIVCNSLLRIDLDSDIEAWRRRILWITYNNPPPAEKIPNFDRLLLDSEGSGVLNWGLLGAKRLLENEGRMEKSAEQKARIDVLMRSASPVETFVRNFVKPVPGSAVTTEEAVRCFYRLCEHFQWPAMPQRKVEQELKEKMLRWHNVTTRTDIKYGKSKRRGYWGVQINLPAHV